MSARIRVLLADDTPAARDLLTARHPRDIDIQIVGLVNHPAELLNRLRTDAIDVIVADLEAQRLGGAGLVSQIMAQRPTPVVVFSRLLGRHATLGIAALSAGAVATVRRPPSSLPTACHDAGVQLVAAIREAAKASFHQRRATPINSAGLTGASLVPQSSPPGLRSKNSADVMMGAPSRNATTLSAGPRLIAIGASTGGTQALEAVLCKLPVTCAGIVIVQHMPERFTALFATRLNELSAITVAEARDGDIVRPGCALIAPGGRHLMVVRRNGGYAVDVRDGPLVNRHKPSVDLLFRSVAVAAGRNALGVLMTGMGDDGAIGLREMRDAGATTVAQDEASCVVYGMPKAAVAAGAVGKVVPLARIASEIIAYT